jgi:hypothetical protein
MHKLTFETMRSSAAHAALLFFFASGNVFAVDRSLEDRVTNYIAEFNSADANPEVANLIPNVAAAEWILANAPRFECPSPTIEKNYYFRWWTYRKHIRQTPYGRILTEFLLPVSHAGPYNSVSCALGHHLAEGRWLRDQTVLDEYLRFWLHSGPNGGPASHLHQFSGWLAAAIWDRYLVTGDCDGTVAMLDDLIADYRRWQIERQRPDGLFWQYDVRDGMEESISGDRRVENIRPTINAYMAANARAIAHIATLANRPDATASFQAEAEWLQSQLLDALWDRDAEFFKVRRPDGSLSDAREAIGFIPFTFNLARPEHAVAWRQLNDPQGFKAPWGITTAEQRHPQFRTHGTGTCEWDGAVWPFATSQTLGGLANVLRGPPQQFVTRGDFLGQMETYARAHQQHGHPYIGEYHDEQTGEWLITGPKAERSRHYNHSTFNDLVISGLVGLVPRADDVIEVDPLLPPDAWDWFQLAEVPYHGHLLTITWDRIGKRYDNGPGLSISVDGRELARSEKLERLTATLPTPSPSPAAVK